MNNQLMERSYLFSKYALFTLFLALPFSKAIVEICSAITIGLWVIRRFVLKDWKARFAELFEIKYKQDIYRRWFHIFMLLYIFFIFCTLFYTVEFSLSFRAFFSKTLKVFGVYMAILEIFSDKKAIKQWGLIAAITAGYVFFDGLIQFLFKKEIIRGFPRGAHGAITACFHNANDFAGWVLTVFPAGVCGLFMSNKEKVFSFSRKAILMMIVILGFFCLIRSYARGAYLGFVVGTIFFVLFFFFMKRQKLHFFFKLRNLLIASGFIVVIGLVAYGQFSNMTHSELTKTTSVRTRIDLWSKAWELVKMHHYIGSGLNTYSHVTQNTAVITLNHTYPHNSYLHMMEEIGIHGLMAFLLMLYCFFRYVIVVAINKQSVILLTMACGLLAFLVQSAFDTHLYALKLAAMLWFMLAMIQCMARVKLHSD